MENRKGKIEKKPVCTVIASMCVAGICHLTIHQVIIVYYTPRNGGIYT